MYIYYFVYKEGYGDISADGGEFPSKWLSRPSECCWIVPGTVDPNE